ncbi:MAG: hypothetical protein HY540_08440 [Deltaproteobacteria bacterium]|nr:hypothetical protein [Deltaproteobacteria bacterium]
MAGSGTKPIKAFSSPNPWLTCKPWKAIDGNGEKTICLPAVGSEVQLPLVANVGKSSTNDDVTNLANRVKIVIRGTPGQIQNPGAICRSVGYLSHGVGKGDSLADKAFSLVLLPVEIPAMAAESAFTAVGVADEFIIPAVGGMLGVDETALNDRQSWQSWLLRGGVASAGIFGYHSVQAARAAPLGAHTFQQAASLTGKTLRNNAKFGLAGWMVASGVLKSTHEITDHVPGVSNLRDEPREMTEQVLSIGLVTASMAAVYHEYSELYLKDKEKVAAAERQLASAVTKAEKKAAKAALRNATHISRLRGLAWTAFFLALNSYFRVATDQQRGLTAIDGKNPYAAFWPPNWEAEYYNRDLLTNGNTSWGGTASLWVMAAIQSGRTAEYLYGRWFGLKREVVMPFSVAEKGVLASLRNSVLETTRPWSLGRGWGHLQGFGQSFRFNFTKNRAIFTALNIASGVIISSVVGRAVAFGRGYRDPNVLKRASVRMVFTRSLGALGMAPILSLGINPSSFLYFAPGMTFIIPAYDFCNEREEGLSQLAQKTLRRYERTTDPKVRKELAVQMRTFEAAADGNERAAITKLLEENSITVFGVAYENNPETTAEVSDLRNQVESTLGELGPEEVDTSLADLGFGENEIPSPMELQQRLQQVTEPRAAMAPFELGGMTVYPQQGESYEYPPEPSLSFPFRL